MTASNASSAPGAAAPGSAARAERAARRAFEAYEAWSGGTRRWSGLRPDQQEMWRRVSAAARRSR
jgi:hypothetical protein